MTIWARIGRLLRGFSGRGMRKIDEQNPEALMESAQQEFHQRMNQYIQALARLGGLAERLKGQIRAKADKLQELERRILTNHRAGNDQLAGSLAREFEDARADLQAKTEELAETENHYQVSLQQAQLAQSEFQEKLRRLERRLSKVKLLEAQAEAAGALMDVAFSVGGLGDTTKTVEDALTSRYELSVGKVRLAHDPAEPEPLQESETQRRALEQVALAEFLTGRGLALPAQTPPPDATEETRRSA